MWDHRLGVRIHYLVIDASLSFKVVSGDGDTSGSWEPLSLESQQTSSFICSGFVSIWHLPVGRGEANLCANEALAAGSLNSTGARFLGL